MAQYQRPNGLKWLASPLEMLEKGHTHTEAFIYAYMLNRYGFFKGIGGEFFENVEVIARNTGHSPATIKRALKALKDSKHIDVFAKKAQKGHSNSYVVHDLYRKPKGDDAPAWEQS